jgi:hypothetical protein
LKNNNHGGKRTGAGRPAKENKGIYYRRYLKNPEWILKLDKVLNNLRKGEKNEKQD